MAEPTESSPAVIVSGVVTSRRKIFLLIVLCIGSVIGLISGSTFLESPFVGGLPVGNVLVAVALCSAAGVAICLTQPATLVRYASLASLAAAAAWLPVSIGLAGNLALNFNGSRGQAWVWVTLATLVVVLAVLAWAIVDHLIRRRGSEVSRHP